MKKKLISLMLVFCTLFITSIVSAKELSKDDIPNNSYVIGTHLFTRETSGDYKGTLTVQYIMLASQTINSNNISDMTIYYKNARGKWVNPLTNESINISNNINIEYKNSSFIQEKISYGDINSDDEIDIFDAAYILQYSAGTIELTEAQKKMADVNNDGYIDQIDADLILGFDAGLFPNTLPDKPITDYVIYGDTLNIGRSADYLEPSSTPYMVVEHYLNGYTNYLEGQALKNADVNGDGVVDTIDKAIMYWFVNGYFQGKLPSLLPLTDYVLYGDVNNDGIVDIGDTIILLRYINNLDILSKQGYKNADINADGSVDYSDYEILLKALSSDKYFESSMPSMEPIQYTDVFTEEEIKEKVKENIELELQYPQSKFYDNGNYIFYFTLSEIEPSNFNLSTWNLYELDGLNNKNLIGTSKSLEQPIKVSIPVNEIKSLVIGIIYKGEELFIDAGSISAKDILENNYPSFNKIESKTISYDADNDEYTYTLSLVNDFDLGGDAGKYISGYELYEVKDNNKQLINSYGVDGIISNMKIKSNETKVYVARAYALAPDNTTRIYSDYSNSFEVNANDFSD